MGVRVRATRSTRLLWLLAVMVAGAAALLEWALAGSAQEQPPPRAADEVPFDAVYDVPPDGSVPAGANETLPTESSAITPK